MPSMWQFLSLLGISCQLMLASDGAKSNVTAFTSYGAVFQPLDPATVPVVDPNNATVLTLCELWENESIPVTPGIEMALRRIRPHFASKNIAFRILRKSIPAGCGDDSIIAVAPALVSMHMNESKTGCSLVIGPSCTETMYNIRGLTMAWDVPVVTSGASGIKFEDKKKTTVLTRFGYTQEDVSLFVVRILDHYNWSTVIMLYDADSAARDFQQAFQQVIQTSRMDLYKKIDFVPLLSTLLEGTTGDAQYMDDILLKLSERARIIIIAASPPVVLQVLVSAEKLGMTGPEYAYITTNLIEKKTHGFSDMSFFDDQAKASDHARKLLDSLLVVRMQLPSEHGGSELSKADSEAEFSQFSNAIKTISQQQFNYTYAFNEQVTHLVLGIWDATMMYALAVNATLFAGESIYAGRNVTLRMWGHSFMGIAIECTISKYGDRNFPYYLLDYSESEEMFKPVVFFENEQLKLIDLKPIHWPGNGDEAPLDVPRCGFTGNAAICQKTGMPVYGTILLIISALLVIFGVLGLAFYRIKLSRISDDAWKAKSSDIILRDRRVPKGGSSRSLQKGPDDARTLQSGTIATTKDSRLSSISYVATAYYKENLVAIKNLGVQLSHLPAETVSELRLLRQQQHEHIARFYAFCQDSETQCILTEFCPKGSLTDLIENEAINLDWSFKFSLLNDIANGLQYIHHSAFKSHGRITSNNCLIDGRFVVKISDLGLTSFRLSAVSLQKCAQIHYPELNSAMRVLLWRSPELLRAPMPKNGTLKGDIYSVGILIQQLALRRGPYERTDLEIGQPDISEIVARVRDGLIPPYRPRVPFDVAPPELYSIMLCCWSELPLDRFDCDQLRTQLRRVPGNKSGNLMDNLLGRMEKYAMDLEELVNERTSAFMDEKKRSEELLYQMLPRAVANKLKQGLYVEPEAFESVTIYFSDIVGFTTLSATSTPMEVVDLLNDLYTLFDGVIEAYDVYKVETIGDAYVVVSGLPQRNDQRHCVEIANMSIHVMAAIKAFRIRHKPNETLSLRIGMHTGPCAAGVVGLKMPRYCIFGDSVNIASRLETTSEGMKIHVSLASKNILSWCKDFILEYRGNVDLKGRGMMETYWLHSASELLLTPSKLPVANRP